MSLGLEPPGWCRPPAERCDGDCQACHRHECEERGAECAELENCEQCPHAKWCAREITEGDEK